LILVSLWVQQLANSAPTQFYEFKGDSLGMSLEEFKQRHFYKPLTHNKSAPFCSDDSRGANAVLLADESYLKAGLVNCRITFPFEDSQGRKVTIANSNAIAHLFHFVDKRLYQITIVVNHTDFPRVRDALVEKYSSPHGSKKEVYQNAYGATFAGEKLTWTNGISSVELSEYAADLRTTSIVLMHHELAQKAQKLKPKPKPRPLRRRDAQHNRRHDSPLTSSPQHGRLTEQRNPLAS
jgi:hypothetical protein